MNILREHIHDHRFLRLIEGALKAGYWEEWTYHPSRSGTPQGGIVSPILSNIYMDRVDQFGETTLIPAYTRGKRRKANPAYTRLAHQAQYHRNAGNIERAKLLRKKRQAYPSVALHDDEYRRPKYRRYADDFLLGLAGPKAEAEDMKERLTTFLGTARNLTLSAEKTLITHAHTGRATFLGYEIGVMQSQSKCDSLKSRVVNEGIGLYIPKNVIQTKRKRFLRNGKVIDRPALMNESEFDIIPRYQGE